MRENHSGSWGTSSQDFIYLAKLLYGHSAEYAKRCSDGNCSAYTPAGIPILFSALRCLLIELNADIFHMVAPVDANRRPPRLRTAPSRSSTLPRLSGEIHPQGPSASNSSRV